MAFSLEHGKMLWETTVLVQHPADRIHRDGTWASNSPVTDGERVYSYFGSRGLFCLDWEGTLLWKRQLGKMKKRMSFGEDASPALYGDTLVVVQDHEGQSFIVALDKRTGEEKWRANRDEISSWSTPYILKTQGKVQVVTNATRRVRSYDLATGKVLWECSGMTANVIPMPVHADGLIYFMSGFRGNALLAVRFNGAKANIDGTDAVAWTLDRNTPSPVLNKGSLYFLRRNDSILTCVDAKTGKEHYSAQRFRQVGTVYASLVAAKDRIYMVGKKGITLVFQHGTKCKVLAENRLDDLFTASPAIKDKRLILRGEKNLYCIRE